MLTFFPFNFCVLWGFGYSSMDWSDFIRMQFFVAKCVLSHFSHVWLFATLRTVACQVSQSIRFSRQEYWSGLPCPHPGDPPDPGIEPTSLMSPALAGGFFTSSATWKALWKSTGQFLHRMSLLFPHDWSVGFAFLAYLILVMRFTDTVLGPGGVSLQEAQAGTLPIVGGGHLDPHRRCPALHCKAAMSLCDQ